MRKIKFWIAAFLIFNGYTGLHAQSNQNQGMRSLPHTEVLKVSQSYSAPVTQQSLRIEEGKVWLNGNLIPENELPPGLTDISPVYRLQLSFQGTDEIKVTLFGEDYLLKNGQIVVLPPRAESPQVVPVPTTDVKEDYYNDLKQQQPIVFDRMTREAQLYEECMLLAIDYQTADESRRQIIRDQLRVNLSQQFDLSIENMEIELRFLEEEIKAIKADIEFRRRNKTDVIEERLEILTKP